MLWKSCWPWGESGGGWALQIVLLVVLLVLLVLLVVLLVLLVLLELQVLLVLLVLLVLPAERPHAGQELLHARQGGRGRDTVGPAQRPARPQQHRVEQLPGVATELETDRGPLVDEGHHELLGL